MHSTGMMFYLKDRTVRTVTALNPPTLDDPHPWNACVGMTEAMPRYLAEARGMVVTMEK